MHARSAVLGKCLLALAFALLTASPPPAYPEIIPSPPNETPDDTPVDAIPKDVPPPVDEKGTGSSMAAMDAGGATSSTAFNNPNIRNNPFSGTAVYSIPIEVPPGRNGIAPNIALNYSSASRNGWVGVGWNLDMGAIQRSTKFGVNYTSNDFIATVNGSSSELVSRGDWGSNYYGAKIEGAFLKYYYDNTMGRWEVTAKNGTKYYYGSSATSRQDNASVVFKWCLDKVQDTNGNYMDIAYVKDQGEIYLNRIDYTGNSNLSPTKYVKFYLDNTRSDAPDMYVPNFRVKTVSRLKTIEVGSSGLLVRAYKFDYNNGASTSRSTLSSVQQYGDDAIVTSQGTITSGTMLPEIGFQYQDRNIGDEFDEAILTDVRSWDNPNIQNQVGDFNGDGKADFLVWYAPFSNDRFNLYLSNGHGFEPAVATNIMWYDNPAIPIQIGDFNGDGNADVLVWHAPYFNNRYNLYLSNGNGFDPAIPTDVQAWGNSRIPDQVGDFNGDGKADILVWHAPFSNDRFNLYLSNGHGFEPAVATNIMRYDNPAIPNRIGDFNGDGNADVLAWHAPYFNNRYNLYLSNENGFDPAIPTDVQAWGNSGIPDQVGDFNGDGKADILVWYAPFSNDRFNLYLSNGHGFEPAVATNIMRWDNPAIQNRIGDYNGDGRTDVLAWHAPYYNNRYNVYLSRGDGFGPAIPTNVQAWGNGSIPDQIGDFDGDGKEDILVWYAPFYSERFNLYLNSAPFPDLLSNMSNGLGGVTNIEYESSSAYQNTLLPFPVHIVKSISANDNNGVISTSSYAYSGGYYDIAERDFRGFGYVKQVNPDQTTAETWYLQDNVFKGLVSTQVVKDFPGNIYTQTNNTYESTSPYSGCAFPFLRQTDGYLYDGTPSYKHVAASFEYGDAYGNVTRKYHHGDVAISGDERDERIEYSYDTTKWIISQPSHTYVMDNAAQSWFAYDSANGNLLSKTDWLENGVNPVTQFTYNSYGNRITTTDPKNNITTVSYDPTYTYPTTVTNQYFGFSSSKTYDSRYGKPLTETDINGNTTTYQYDVFGRLNKIINPYDNASTEGTQSIHYENFGMGAGYQRVATHSTEQSGTGNYHWQENYFDGFGRTIKTRSEGPDGKVIVAEIVYDTMGRVSFSSLPHFEGEETPRWVSYSYDPMGRVTRVTNPDNTYVTRSYLLGTTASIDANGHKREEDRDAFGRLVKVREYTGNYPNFTLYATTAYRYDTLGNLVQVIDAAGNITNISYDTLSRKTSMTDPDMGYWSYGYDANGNLTSQTDARNYTITFSYDALNRLTNKHYPTGPDVIYTYDELFSTNPKGRLTTVSDLSGTTKFHYDMLGRVTRTVKNVDGVEYTTDSTYDALGRTTGITYPDTGRETVSYTYNTGGSLQDVVGYATFSNYNALGQAGLVAYGNGDNTVYQFNAWNNRLYSLTANSQTQGGLQDLAYAYDNVGNIQSITDLIDPTRTQGFQYDDLNRIAQAQSTVYGTLTYNIDAIGNMTYNSQVGGYTYLPAKPHAVVTAGGNSYSYDPNGNMMGRNGATLTHDYENRLSSLVTGGTTTTFVYDAAGGRVKKTSSSITTLYIGKLYECTSGVCTKHIFAGGNRIVSKKPSGTYYYHTDHLGSSSVVTDASGAKVEEIYYYPFGQTRVNSGSVNLKHKYTGQEEDAETGLYFYNARYYDPAIGRFVSADTFVQNFSDPQSFNRYSYARNNPLYYVDPSGHYWQIVIGAVVGAVVGGIVAEARGQNVEKGMLYGAISGAFIGAGDYISGGSFIGVVGGGAAGGGATTAVAGGSGDDTLKGMLYGAAGAAAGYGVGYGFEQYGISNEYLNFGSQVVGGGLVGGGIAELSGGNFSEGFMSGAIGAAAGYGIGRFMKWNSAQNEMMRKQAEAEGNLNVKSSDSIPTSDITNEGRVAELFLFGRSPTMLRSLPRGNGPPPEVWWDGNWTQPDLPPGLQLKGPLPNPKPVPWYYKPWPFNWKPEPPHPHLHYQDREA